MLAAAPFGDDEYLAWRIDTRYLTETTTAVPQGSSVESYNHNASTALNCSSPARGEGFQATDLVLRTIRKSYGHACSRRYFVVDSADRNQTWPLAPRVLRS